MRCVEVNFMLEWLRFWYEADSRPAHGFRYGLLGS
jgi:hypothetical protein